MCRNLSPAHCKCPSSIINSKNLNIISALHELHLSYYISRWNSPIKCAFMCIKDSMTTWPLLLLPLSQTKRSALVDHDVTSSGKHCRAIVRKIWSCRRLDGNAVQSSLFQCQAIFWILPNVSKSVVYSSATPISSPLNSMLNAPSV